jgi:alpha-D-xyloside xylohydrolase
MHLDGGEKNMRNRPFPVLNQPPDVSQEFARFENTFFNAARVTEFDPVTLSGALEWRRAARQTRLAFGQITTPMDPVAAAPEFPPDYEQNPILPFALHFVGPRTVRVRLTARGAKLREEPSLMLAGEVPVDTSWKMTRNSAATTYTSAVGCSVTVTHDPWHIEFRDASGRLLTRTQNLADTMALSNTDPTPFSFVRCAADGSRHLAASFLLAPDEKLYGCGESFTRLNKRGQRQVLCTTDAHGVQTSHMYKPIPFLLSSRGYAMFVHSTAPMTFDLGGSYDAANVLYLGDEQLDLFFFFGDPKEVLSEYTALTGRSPTPPLWSFGLWMSRITYQSEDEVREVAARLRHERVPCDVIHLDTGWFEQDWRCNYRFAPTRFRDPQKMIVDLREQGLRVSLWQLPYFTPHNELFAEAIARGFVVRSASGDLPTEDAVIDFSNPDAVRWYQELLAPLLKMGVGAIKVDFGEAAPFAGLYASGKTGFYEHNLYPLRYNKAAAEITRRVTGEAIIWARSTWAGSQRYPLHWGGDAENTDCAMAATLRAGLSLGLCGFSFWSHDAGGFVQSSPRALYRRWMPFAMLTSHSRCHGAPPKEPWAYDAAFTDDFRRAVELKYRLMPYIYAQARACSEQGYPMLRTLFFEYPADPTSWLIEDEYLLGRDLLVAPLMEEVASRDVYLPPGAWIDYQTGKRYVGEKWQHIAAGTIPVVLLVREGAVIPHVPLAQSTAEITWREIELVLYGHLTPDSRALVCFPDDGTLRTLPLRTERGALQLDGDPFAGRVRWNVRRFGEV